MLRRVQRRRGGDHSRREGRNHAHTDRRKPGRLARPASKGRSGDRADAADGRLRRPAPQDARDGAGPAEHGRRHRRPAGGDSPADDRRAAFRQTRRAVRILPEPGDRRIVGRNRPGTGRMSLDSGISGHGGAGAADRIALPRRAVRRKNGDDRRIHGRNLPARNRPSRRNSLHRPDGRSPHAGRVSLAAPVRPVRRGVSDCSWPSPRARRSCRRTRRRRFSAGGRRNVRSERSRSIGSKVRKASSTSPASPGPRPGAAADALGTAYCNAAGSIVAEASGITTEASEKKFRPQRIRALRTEWRPERMDRVIRSPSERRR